MSDEGWKYIHLVSNAEFSVYEKIGWGGGNIRYQLHSLLVARAQLFTGTNFYLLPDFQGIYQQRARDALWSNQPIVVSCALASALPLWIIDLVNKWNRYRFACQNHRKLPVHCLSSLHSDFPCYRCVLSITNGATLSTCLCISSR